jgi:cytochrome c
MKYASAVSVLVAGLTVANAAYANEKLAQSSGCMTCHGVDKKIIGPSFKEIGTKYAGQAGAEETLFKRVKAGSKGTWGSIPMPPNAHVKDHDVKALVRWTLTLK